MHASFSEVTFEKFQHCLFKRLTKSWFSGCRNDLNSKKMPSPKRESGSKIAYTRWEPLEASTEDLEASTNTNNNNVVPFHHFEEEDRTASEQSTTSKLRLSPRTLIINGSQRPLSRRSSSRHHVKCWEWSVRILGILIGTSWYYTLDVSIV